MSEKESKQESAERCDRMELVVDHLCCKICYEPYTETGEREPKVLKCGHSVCLCCINMIYKKKNMVLCPFCKVTQVVGPKSLPKNFDIVCMIPHYPKLPANQQPCNVEFEKLKVQWESEQAFVSQLRSASENAKNMVVQTTNQLAAMKSNALAVEKYLQGAESDLKATEDSLRLFVDLHPDDPKMLSLAEQLNKSNGRKSVANIINAWASQHTRREKNASSICSSSFSSGDHIPPPPPRPNHGIGRNSESFQMQIAHAAANMHRLNNPDSVDDDINIENFPQRLEAPPPPQQQVYSPRQQMLNLIRRFGGN